MKLIVVAVGQRMPRWVVQGCDEYLRRMPRDSGVELVEIRPAARSGNPPLQRVLELEQQRIVAALAPGCLKVVLDEKGVSVTSAQLAQRMVGWREAARDVAFIIGGADGIAPALKRSADLLLSLSALTLPHGLARVLLAEQLYRAVMILRNHPYHRE
jgi:23S rRNA (pseudouridine1915-N3)-methyltransferase